MSSDPRNLLVILSDQHNRDTLGCYGHPVVRTPNLDALARRGTRFSSAYCNCPISVPSRASFATGQFVHRIGAWDNAFPYHGQVPSWAHHLTSHGHQVVSIGKLHHRRDDDRDGFSEKRIPLNVVDGIGDLLGAIRDDPPRRPGRRDGVIQAGPGQSTYLDYDVRIADQASTWLQQAAGARHDKPWVLFVSFVCPHPPFIAPPDLFESYMACDFELPVQNSPDERPKHPALETLRHIMDYIEPFTPEQIRRVTAAYYGTCTHLDQQVGKVLDRLEQTGLGDSTRVIYATDHGESMGRRGLWGKFTLYEESAAVPFLIAGPDVPEGHMSNEPVTLVDCFPTICDFVGTPAASRDYDLCGQSLWPVLEGQSLGRCAFSEYHAVGFTDASFMVRNDEYKLIHWVNAPAQLFNIIHDPNELHDLSEDQNHASALELMQGELRSILDPQAIDARAKSDQRRLIAQYGGRQAVLARGTFANSPVPGETPKFLATDDIS